MSRVVKTRLSSPRLSENFDFSFVKLRRLRRPRAMPLAMITMIKLIHGFPLLPYIGMGLRLVALRALKLRYNTIKKETISSF